MSAIPLLRSAMQPVSRAVRACFAPVARASAQPSIFDPSAIALFNLDSPPSPWLNLGVAEKFSRTSKTSVEAVRSGMAGALAGQYRSLLDAEVELEFRDWGKLQMALAGGSQHMNVLESTSGSAAPCGGPARAAVVIQSGSTASEIFLNASGLARFSPGDMIAVDRDYHNETGWLCAGISAVYVTAGDGITRDLDFLRRLTFNVARVAEKRTASLALAQPLPGGIPTGTVGVQKIIGFVDREGGSFFQEWSALFVLPEDSGGRICYYYPRLQSAAGGAEGENAIAPPLAGRTLRARFRALPYTDSLDGERVLCYRSYFPPASSPVF